MSGSLDVQLISKPDATSSVLLSVGYNAGFIVIELDGMHDIEALLSFLRSHAPEKGAGRVEVGRFGAFPVTLYIDGDLIAVVADTDLDVDSFGQAAGIHIPIHLLGEFTQRLGDEHGRFRQ